MLVLLCLQGCWCACHAKQAELVENWACLIDSRGRGCSCAHKCPSSVWHMWNDSLFESLLRFRVGIGKPHPVVSCWFQSWKARLLCPVTYTETHFELSCSSLSTLAACWRRVVSICLMVRNVLVYPLVYFSATRSLLACSSYGKPHLPEMRELDGGPVFPFWRPPREGGA